MDVAILSVQALERRKIGMRSLAGRKAGARQTQHHLAVCLLAPDGLDRNAVYSCMPDFKEKFAGSVCNAVPEAEPLEHCDLLV